MLDFFRNLRNALCLYSIIDSNFNVFGYAKYPSLLNYLKY